LLSISFIYNIYIQILRIILGILFKYKNCGYGLNLELKDLVYGKCVRIIFIDKFMDKIYG